MPIQKQLEADLALLIGITHFEARDIFLGSRVEKLIMEVFRQLFPGTGSSPLGLDVTDDIPYSEINQQEDHNNSLPHTRILDR